MSKNHVKVVRYTCLVVGLVGMGAGILLGQPGQVWSQAIRICLECIGIG